VAGASSTLNITFKQTTGDYSDAIHLLCHQEKYQTLLILESRKAKGELQISVLVATDKRVELIPLALGW
jgi:hypothetical protein